MPPPHPATAMKEPPAATTHPWHFFRGALTQFDWTKVDAARGLRNALGVALPLAVGAMVGQINPAIVVATGALNVSFADGTEPYLPRLQRLLAACLLVALAVFCGSLSGWTLPGTLAVIALWSFGAGMLVSLGVQVGNLGVSCACVLLIFASRPLPLRDASLCGLLALGGGLFQALLSVVLWPVRRDEPERLALAALYLRLADLGDHPLALSQAPAGTSAANAAASALAGRLSDHSTASARYRVLLDQAERIRVCILTLRSLRQRLAAIAGAAPRSAALDDFFAASREVLQSAGETLRSGRPSVEHARLLNRALDILEAWRSMPSSAAHAILFGDIETQMDALARQLRIVSELANNATPQGQLAYARVEAARPWKLRSAGALSTLRANLNLRSTTFRHALRLAACVTGASALGHFLGWNRPYWLPLTVAVVLKPDFSSTFSRGVLRLGGTFAGLLIATALFHLLPRTLAVEIAVIMATTFLLRWIGPAHYGVLALTVSELVVLLVALTGVTPDAAIISRARNTALGGILALLAYWLWPTWEKTQVAENFARMLDAYRHHLGLLTRAFAGQDPDLSASIDRSRAAARLSRTNLEASVDRVLAEPATSPLERHRWQSMLATSHILAHSIIMLHASLLAAPDSLLPLARNAAFQDFINDVTLALTRLAMTLRGADDAAFPDLRKAHYRLLHSGEPMAARHTLISVETDKMVNSLNTLREQAAPRTEPASSGAPAGRGQLP